MTKSKLIILVRNYLLVFWGGFKYNKKTSKIIGSSIAMIVGVLLFAALMGFVAYGQIISFSAIGQPHLAFYYFLMISFMMAVLTAVMRGSISNNATDADMLLAMPLSRRTILLSKSISKYFFELLPITAFFLPAVIMYGVMVSPGFLTVLRGLIVWLMIPFLSVGISYILSWLFFKISDKMKNPSGITSFLSLVVIFGFVAFNTFGAGGAAAEADPAAFYTSITFLRWAVDFMVQGSALGWLKFALITIGPFVLGLILNSSIFGVQHRTWKSNKKEIDYRRRSPGGALLKKEMARFFGSSGYLMNTGMGMIMSLLLTVVLVIGKNSFLAEFLAADGISEIMGPVLVLVYCCCAGMSYLTACSISLEGKQLWILRTIPVRTKDVFFAKIKANLLVTLPLTVLGVLVAGIVLDMRFLEVLIITLTCGVFCVMSAYIGLVLNLHFPKLDWKEEVQVVKQGMSVMMALLLAFIPIAVLFVGYLLFFNSFIAFAPFCLLVIVVFLAVIFFCQRWLAGSGSAIFEKL